LQRLVEVRPCPHGKGVFAKKRIPRDGVIWKFEEVVLTTTPRSLQRRNRALRIGEHEYWDEAPEESPDHWANFIDHSNDPNARFVFDRKNRRAWFKATRPIAAGEEVFINYRDYYHSNPAYDG